MRQGFVFSNFQLCGSYWGLWAALSCNQKVMHKSGRSILSWIMLTDVVLFADITADWVSTAADKTGLQFKVSKAKVLYDKAISINQRSKKCLIFKYFGSIF